MCGIHKNCGGELFYDETLPPYEYVTDPPTNKVLFIYPLMCRKCGEEIISDLQIEDLPGP
jgi:hypothetical protein